MTIAYVIVSTDGLKHHIIGFKLKKKICKSTDNANVYTLGNEIL